jgi:PAS domain S-box-containing protein
MPRNVDDPWLQRFVPLLESLADGVLLVGRDGQVVFANEAAARLYGVPIADLTGPIDQFPARFEYRTASGDRPPSVGTRALAGEVVAPAERRIRTPAGEGRGVRTSATPVRDDTGAIVGALVLVGDVTLEQDEVARARAEAERLNRAWHESQVAIAARQLALEVIEHGDPMYVLDGEFRYLLVNREWERLTGVPRERVLGKTMWEVFPPSAEPGSPLWVELNRCRRERVPVEFESHYAPLGLWLAHRAFPTEHGMSVFLHDVSGRKRAELALRRSEARLRRLYESGLFGVQHFDLRGGVVDANDAFLAMIGRTREELERGALTWDALTPPEHREADRRALEALRRDHVVSPYEKEFVRRDGTRVPVIVGDVLLEEERERGIAFVLDITEQRRARDALVAADRRKNEFLGMLSHELRNPLAPIRNALFMLRNAPPGGPLADRAQRVIERQTEQLARLVDDLLDVTRISRGKISLRRAVADLAALVRRTCEDQRTVFDAAGLGLNVDAPAGPVWADVDAARVVQVLGNLLQNAAKFTPAGGEVRVALAVEGARAVLRVRDTGIGIPAEELQHLFEPFVQGDLGLARTRGGLGLGLALARGLTLLHGGTIRAASAGAGRGAEFTVTLPLAGHAAPDAGTGARAAPAPARPRTVLVIEDNLDAARTLADVLELQGHRVHLARNGAEGLALAREVRPDLVLCDIGLPDLDGYAIAREIRRDPEIGATPLVALSGYAQQEDRERSAQAGFDAHLPKPTPIEALEGLLRERARSPG